MNRHRQKVGMVFQQFDPFNNLTVLENITIFRIKVRGTSQAGSEAKGMTLLKRVGLDNKAGSYPSQLSGGQKQGIAIVRELFMDGSQIVEERTSEQIFEHPQNPRTKEFLSKVINVI